VAPGLKAKATGCPRQYSKLKQQQTPAMLDTKRALAKEHHS